MDKIELKLDESNELVFRLTIEGTAESASAIRFVCENGEDVSYMFKGATDPNTGEIRINIPPMSGKMKGGLYEGRLEVIVEGRCLEPMKCLADFRTPLKVVAESVQVSSPAKPELKATASVVSSKIAPKAEPVNESQKSVSRPKTLAEKFGHKR